jgi:hypothetical protein
VYARQANTECPTATRARIISFSYYYAKSRLRHPGTYPAHFPASALISFKPAHQAFLIYPQVWHDSCLYSSVTKKYSKMKKTDNFSMIITLFRDLSKSAQVEIMTMLYYEMYDHQKDEFLRETENA